jgi:aminomuconate-semialdehyde/2-hydroxymuconate-6-semialdehyde dehydrogenase
MKQFLNYINGEFVATDKTFEKRAPINNQIIGMVHEAGLAEVDQAVTAAREALKGDWGKLTTVKRVEMLYAIADEINRRFDDFLEAEMADTGKPRSLASHIDIPRGAANFKVFADIIKNVPNETFQMDTPDGGKAINYAIRKPLGVIGVVCPWNLPLLLMTWKVGPALACGNTVVIKPSEETPGTTTLLGEVFEKVGVPKGVYNVVHGFGPNSAGEFLTKHPGVNGITFTGETRTGEVIMAAAAKGLRSVSFELGGKNAAIVFEDCDFDKAIAGVTRSAFENCGQVCLGTERVYVQRSIFDKFVAALKLKAEGLKMGPSNEPGVSLGPLISAEHKQKVTSYYAKAVAEGATVITGGGTPKMADELKDGHWIQPTIWTGLPETAAVIREEIFGPCCHIAPFDTEEEVIALVNNTSYGLATSVWTENIGRAHRMAEAIEVGVCWINSWFLRDLRTPFGGAKGSGIGREGGVHSLEFYTELRNVCVKL